MSFVEQQEILRRVEGLFALADQPEVRLTKARGQVDQLTPSLFARAWTHSPLARSGCALSLPKILFTRSQRVQIAGQLVPQDPTDEPAEELLERISGKCCRRMPGGAEKQIPESSRSCPDFSGIHRPLTDDSALRIAERVRPFALAASAGR